MSIFDRVEYNVLPRHTFNMSHRNLLSLNQGYLVPVFCEETVPKDNWNISVSAMLRYASLLAPVMSDAYVSLHWFYVPWYQIWDDYKKWETGGDSGSEDSSIVFPKLRVYFGSSYGKPGSLADYLGVHLVDDGSATASEGVYVNALPFRAYQHIYNNWYRDENLQEEVKFSKASGLVNKEDSAGEYGRLSLLRKRCWEKDYFTSALPWTQKPGTAVSAPIGINSSLGVKTNDPISVAGTSFGSLTVDPSGVASRLKLGSDTSGSLAILELYRTIAIQKFRDICAVAGTRINEFIKGHFAEDIDDQSYDIPKYLGGSKQPVVISEVLQTAEGSNDGVGTQYGHAMSVGGDNIRFHAKDRGYIMCLMSVLPRTYYGQGIRKMFLKTSKYDFFYPEFANIGEQEISSAELYYSRTAVSSTFGYTPRYAEYKFIPSGIHGDFLSSLAFWHQGRIFSNEPKLNSSFVESDPTTRIFNVEDSDTNQKIYALLNFKVKAMRSMPYFGTAHI